MAAKNFTLTFKTVTESSAEHGDFARYGYVTRTDSIPETAKCYIPKNPARFTLRKALEIFERYNDGSGPIEADCCPVSRQHPPRWFNTCNQGYDGNENVNVSLHLPRTITPSSAMRIARYLKCYGVR